MGKAGARLAAIILIGAGHSAAAQSDLPHILTAMIDASGVAHIGTAPPNGPAPQVIGGAPQQADATPSSPAALASPCNADKAPTPAEAEALVRRIAAEEDFSPAFAIAVAQAESHFHVERVSPKGAVGIMQLMPATAARFKVDLCDPTDNVRGGVRYLRWLAARYKNPLFVLAAYNAGEAAVDQYHGVPPFPETVQYVATVLNNFYAWPLPGAAQAVAPTHASAQPIESADATAGASWSQGFVMHVEN